MIEAHVQFAGGGWKVYRDLQKGLQCEFDDHRTCKEASARIQTEEDAKTDGEKAELKVRLKKQVDDAAEYAQAQAAQKELNASGQKKFESVRIVNKKAAEALEKIEKDAAEKIGALKAKAVADEDELHKAHGKAVDAVENTRAIELAAIEAIDWLAEVRKEVTGA